MKILITGGNGNLAKIIKKNLNSSYEIFSPGKDELNLLNYKNVNDYLLNKTFNVCFHTAIIGGRRTKEENYDVFYKNLLMFENLMMFRNNFKMIINMDSGAIYNRETDIKNRNEEDIYTIPNDYYGFSKYCIYQRSLNIKNLFNFRIFNIFHPQEENDRFIKLCLINNEININDDKFFDFFYYSDFIKVIEYYLDNIDNQSKLIKTINLSYEKKYKLSEIAKMINSNINIIINNKYSINNYSGNYTKLKSLGIDMLGIENGIYDYKLKLL